ncbi:hypothetical protein D3C71_1532640 [compost metagenome]
MTTLQREKSMPDSSGNVTKALNIVLTPISMSKGARSSSAQSAWASRGLTTRRL